MDSTEEEGESIVSWISEGGNERQAERKVNRQRKKVEKRENIKGEGERNGRRMVLCATVEPAAG